VIKNTPRVSGGVIAPIAQEDSCHDFLLKASR